MKFYFFRQVLVFAVVADIVLLRLVFLNQRLGIFYLSLLVAYCLLILFNLGLTVGDTSVESCNFIFKVLNLQKKFSAQSLDLINFRCYQLKVVKSP